MLVVMPSLLRKVVPRPVADRLRRLIWSLPNLRWTLPSGLGVEVTCPADWVIYNDLFVDGEYDEALDLLVERAADRPRLEILDLGANVGYFTLCAADRLLRSPAAAVPFRFTLVEASPRLVREIERRLAAQAGLAGRVRVVNGLVGRRSGRGGLDERGYHFENTAVAAPVAGARALPFVDLEALYPRGQPIDFLKCDIEGSEEAFLETYSDLMARVQLAVIEIHPNRCDAGRCETLLADLGFLHQKTLRDTRTTTLRMVCRA